MLRKLTPVLAVDSVEPCLAFWVDRLGFTKTAEVPGEGGIGFAILARDGIEVMLQSRRSIAADVPAAASAGPSMLFFEVADLAPIEAALAGADLVVPKRQTEYGSTEIIARTPGGHIVNFAKFPEA